MNILTVVAFSPLAWTALGTPLANHLWQSTLFAAVAGLLTLALRKNRAQVRYWLWLTASVKFFIPFSLLIAMGSHLGLSKSHVITEPGVSFVMQEISQPFAPASAVPTASTAFAAAARLLPTLLLLVWLWGCAGVLLFWWLRWRRVTGPLRGALPLQAGRELEALRRLEQSVGIAGPIKIMVSESALEPGVVGIFRPVMLLPAGISDRLTDAQLEAIIAHELCHVRRRDNLLAAIHMLVEALFWFHPLVWWIGARLVDERERACDEEVLRLGSEPQAYAESILKVCEFYLESPLVCVTGVTGSNLKKRIEDIMTHRIASKLDFTKKLLLATIGMAVVAVPIAIGFLNPTPSRAQSQPSPVFEDVSIKRSKPDANITMMIRESGSPDWTATNVTLKRLIQSAYGLKDLQILGGPSWLTTEKYDLHAKVDPANPQIGPKLQALLADRFKLTVHRETKELPVYELVVGTNGSKLKEAPPGEVGPSKGRFHIEKGHLVAQQVPIDVMAGFLSNSTGRMVLDKTGLKGVYDITLDWTPGDSNSVVTAVSEQLGLKLNPQTAPVEILVVDHAEELNDQETPSTAHVN